MNADELDALLDGLPEEVTSVSKQSSVASRQGPPQPPPPRFPRATMLPATRNVCFLRVLSP